LLYGEGKPGFDCKIIKTLVKRFHFLTAYWKLKIYNYPIFIGKITFIEAQFSI
jgi:hypothetical protein